MNKEFIKYEQALALKELGFDEPCLAYYNKKELFSFTQICNEPLKGHYIKMSNRLCAPLYQQCFRWFREKYKLLGTPQYFTGGFYCYTINDMKDTKKSNRLFTEFELYEEAELECLKKLIEIVKNKKD
jgi:hypothetical protein